MIDLGKVKDTVTSWFKGTTTTTTPTCNHEYVFSNQVWKRVAAKKYAPLNRFECTKCRHALIKEIGE